MSHGVVCAPIGGFDYTSGGVAAGGDSCLQKSQDCGMLLESQRYMLRCSCVGRGSGSGGSMEAITTNQAATGKTKEKGSTQYIINL